MRSRIVFTVVTLLLGFFMPWWFPFLLFIWGSYLFAPWFELIAIGIFYDIVFSIDRSHFHGFVFVYTASAIILVLTLYFIKKKFINV